MNHVIVVAAAAAFLRRVKWLPVLLLMGKDGAWSLSICAAPGTVPFFLALCPEHHQPAMPLCADPVNQHLFRWLHSQQDKPHSAEAHLKTVPLWWASVPAAVLAYVMQPQLVLGVQNTRPKHDTQTHTRVHTHSYIHTHTRLRCHCAHGGRGYSGVSRSTRLHLQVVTVLTAEHALALGRWAKKMQHRLRREDVKPMAYMYQI
eukprot:1161606-Pelagomonas_calceolata.AAC.10